METTSTANGTSTVHYPAEASYFAAACAVLFVLVGISGNLLTMVALLRSRKLRQHATTAFVLSLAAADLIFCAFNLPLTASRYIHQAWIFGDTLCRLFPFFFYGNVAASVLSMVLITVNRYILIASPSLYDKIYQRPLIAAMIAGSWLFAFGLMAPPLAGVWGRLGLKESTFSCTILRGDDGRSPKKLLFAFGFLLPCLAIVVSYTCIFIKVRQSRNNVRAHSAAQNGALALPQATKAKASASKSEKHQRREDLRLTRMMLIIFCCFMLSFLPLMIVNVVDDEDTTRVPSLHVLASILAWASSVVNPFIYAFSNRQYRTAYRQLLCRSPASAAGAAGGNHRVASNHSRSSGRTFLTDMLHYSVHVDKVKIVRAPTTTNTNTAAAAAAAAAATPVTPAAAAAAAPAPPADPSASSA